MIRVSAQESRTHEAKALYTRILLLYKNTAEALHSNTIFFKILTEKTS